MDVLLEVNMIINRYRSLATNKKVLETLDKIRSDLILLHPEPNKNKELRCSICNKSVIKLKSNSYCMDCYSTFID